MGRHVGHMCTSLLIYSLKFLLAVTKCQRNAPSWRRGLLGPMVKGDSLSQWGRCGWKNSSSLWQLPAHIRVDGVTLSHSSSGLLSDTPKGGPYCCLQCSLSSIWQFHHPSHLFPGETLVGLNPKDTFYSNIIYGSQMLEINKCPSIGDGLAKCMYPYIRWCIHPQKKSKIVCAIIGLDTDYDKWEKSVTKYEIMYYLLCAMIRMDKPIEAGD